MGCWLQGLGPSSEDVGFCKLAGQDSLQVITVTSDVASVWLQSSFETVSRNAQPFLSGCTFSG